MKTLILSIALLFSIAAGPLFAAEHLNADTQGGETWTYIQEEH